MDPGGTCAGRGIVPDRALTRLKYACIGLYFTFPLLGICAEIWTDWRLSAEWTTVYIGGIGGTLALAFGLAKLRNGNAAH